MATEKPASKSRAAYKELLMAWPLRRSLQFATLGMSALIIARISSESPKDCSPYLAGPSRRAVEDLRERGTRAALVTVVTGGSGSSY